MFHLSFVTYLFTRVSCTPTQQLVLSLSQTWFFSLPVAQIGKLWGALVAVGGKALLAARLVSVLAPSRRRCCATAVWPIGGSTPSAYLSALGRKEGFLRVPAGEGSAFHCSLKCEWKWSLVHPESCRALSGSFLEAPKHRFSCRSKLNQMILSLIFVLFVC